MENLNNNYVNNPQKGLVYDLDPTMVSKDIYTYARNANLNTHQDNLQYLTDEPANLLCCSLPYDPIGFIKILNNRWVVFGTDNFSSEIGIFNENTCTYARLVNDHCLNFNKSSLIRGAFKEGFDCLETIYWTDSGRNPRRKLKLDEIPYKYTTKNDACNTKEFTHELDCDGLLMTPKLTVPCIGVRLGAGGGLKNGTYQFGIAYTINQQRISEFYSITNPEAIWSHQNFGQSLVVEIDNLDRDFNEFELVMIFTQNSTTTAKRIGYFSTSNNKHNISSIDKPEYITIPLEEIITKRPYYYAADDVVSNDQYILWSGVTSKPELNYQSTAMKIRTKWVLYEVPVDYYANGGNKKGYYRGEVYTFAIQWLYDTGEWSSAFHIPGRKALDTETNIATGQDVYEHDIKNCEVDIQIRNFEVYDTSLNPKTINGSVDCNERVIKEGDMSYWESTDVYADNTVQFGSDACTPIRHPKFPDECHVPRYKKGGSKVNILSVKFENIQHPKDDNGNEITSIVGYRIVRGDRKGNRSVISKGVFKNVRSYNETLDQQGDGQEVLYQNYPYNDLRADNFISSKQTYFKSGEKDFLPLTGYKKDQLTFYSPETLFSKISLGDELVLDTEENGSALTSFENVYNHPRAKLLNNSVFWLAITMGAIDGVLSVFGKKCVLTEKGGQIVTGANAGTITPLTGLGHKYIQDCEDLAHGLPIQDIIQGIKNPIEKVAKIALKILQTAASAGLAVFFAMSTAEETIKTIEEFLPYRKFALQANSKCLLDDFKCIERDFRRKHINFYQYLYDGVNTVNGSTFNNFRREDSVYLKLSGDISIPKIVDKSRNTMSDAGICDTPFKSFNSPVSMYYGGIKRRITNQYGQLDSINYLDTGYCVNKLDSVAAIGSNNRIYKTDAVFGGDVFISKMSVKTTHNYFTQNASNANFQDGVEYDYTLYRNIGYPRFWLDSTKYDIGELLTTGKVPNKLPQNKYNFDCEKKAANKGVLNLSHKGGYFYLFNNSALEFFVESEYNLDYRDYKGELQNFYSRTSTNLTELFRSDRINTSEEFVYDNSFSKELTENAIFQQALDYDPLNKCFTYYKNRVIYSLPAFKDQKGDNWLIYLTNNYYDFPLSQFDAITSMHGIDNQQIMFLFNKSAPYVTIGRDQLQLDGSGVKVTIGDGGLFSREPRPLLFTDHAYGNSQSRWAFNNTQFGSFYPSQRQGNIFNYTGKLEDVSQSGMEFWFNQYLPSKLLEEFPDFKDRDNPVIGVGIISIFSNTDEKYYITKRDYSVKDIYRELITYDSVTNRFLIGSRQIQFRDPKYFDDFSWTISYSPKDKMFVSYHDWKSDWLLQQENHFMSVKDKKVYKHNIRCDLYCNFYGIDYPFSIEFIENNGPIIETLKSIEYSLDVGLYFDDCRYLHTILDENFDSLVVHNNEQNSSLLSLKLVAKNNMSGRLDRPKFIVDHWEVDYSKEENKYRINQFFDLIKDRGEFTHNNLPLWRLNGDGYTRNIEPKSINLTKSQFQRKKFRYFWNKILLTKNVCGNKKFIFKWNNSKNTISPR